MSQAFPGPYTVQHTDQHVKIIGNELGLEFTIAKMVNHPFSLQGRLDTAQVLAAAPNLTNILVNFVQSLADNNGEFNLITADVVSLQAAYTSAYTTLQSLGYFAEEEETP